MPGLIVYGLSSCDTCRKAKKWLQSNAVAFQFHDVRQDGLAAAEVKRWLHSGFANKLINRQSTTWRKLSDKQKKLAASAPQTLLLEHPALVKRPVFERDGKVLAVGFKPETLAAALVLGAGPK
ncbi:MAG TPA: Spx/MgsR family RNA polymerase-binding regulatory protein [Xanthomonadales bacterium]|nr:Spx/MgsR family RNA polymerase-binding regulatory protein [Xanthomonadales bacterium]